MKQHDRLQTTGYSLFEMLISLALLAVIMTLLATTGIQTVKMWSELEEEGTLMNEGRTLMHLLDRDLRNASKSMPIIFNNPSDFCFLTRNANDDLVAVAYFFDAKRQGYYYRFLATAKETLAALHDGKLEELYNRATPKEAHCKLIATHLLSCELIPTTSLIEVHLAFGKTIPRYFLSTVISIPFTNDFY